MYSRRSWSAESIRPDDLVSASVARYRLVILICASWLGLVAMLAGACGRYVPGDANPVVAVPETPTPALSTTPTSSAPSSTAAAPAMTLQPTFTLALPTMLRAAVDRARKDLARRLDLPEERIVLQEVTSDEFPASNLGCPSTSAELRTSIAPMPAIVSGWRIIWLVGQERYEYRARATEVVYCGRR